LCSFFLFKLQFKFALESIIEFATTTFEVTEPVNDDEPAVVSIPVVRRGDLSEPSAVRVFTKDGNAESGKDYNPVSRGKKIKEKFSSDEATTFFVLLQVKQIIVHFLITHVLCVHCVCLGKIS